MKLWIFIYLVLLLGTDTQTTASIDKRTLSGEKSSLKDFPGVVSIDLNQLAGAEITEGYCSGTLLDEYTILTAAHCILSINREEVIRYAFVRTVYAGSEEPLSSNRSKLREKSHLNFITYVHPQYISSKMAAYRRKLNSKLSTMGAIHGILNITHDIAVIKTRIPFQFDNDFKPMKVNLYKPTLVPSKDQCGDIFVVSYSNPDLDTVQFASPDDPLHSKVLVSKNPMLNAHRICDKCTFHKDIFYNYSGNQPLIHGDSGGPLVQIINGKPQQIGVTSCIRSSYNVYTSTFSNRNFITSRMGSKIDECGIPDQEDLSKIYPPMVFNQEELNSLFVWMMVVLNNTGDKVLCVAIHISDDRLVAPVSCFSNLSRGSQRLAGVYEMQVLNRDTSRLLSFDIVKVGRTKQNGIQLFEISPSAIKLFYTRPICIEASIEQVITGKIPIYAIGYRSGDVKVVEQKFIGRRTHNQREFLCTANKDPSTRQKALLPMKYALVAIVNGKYQLLGLGSSYRLGEGCTNSFFHFRHTDFP